MTSLINTALQLATGYIYWCAVAIGVVMIMVMSNK